MAKLARERYDLCARGRMELCFIGAAQIDGAGCANNSRRTLVERINFVTSWGGSMAGPTAPPTSREREALQALDRDGQFERNAAVRLR